MTWRVPHGLFGVAIVVGFLAVGMAADGPRQVPVQGRTTRAVGITWDFETGNLIGWQAAGIAFSTQPTFGDNPRARQRESANPQGQYWIGTFERYQGPGRGTPGGAQGDRPQGTLTSIPFAMPASLTFRIGGGSAFETRVELLLLDQIEGEIRVATATGKNTETMRDMTWDLAKWAGRQGRIRIVDASSVPWGHINVDDFRFGPARRGLETFIPSGGRQVIREPEPEVTTVPNLIGRTEREARDLLAKARLRVGKVTNVEDYAKPGTVANQDLEGGNRVAIGTPIGFALAMPVTTIVPDVVGRSEREARAMLSKARLRTGAIRSEPSRLPSGQVLAQGPKGGDRVPVDSDVDLVVAEVITVAVPRLIDRSQKDAAALLKQVDLVLGNVTVEESRRPVGTVLSQNPKPGALVALGSKVEIVAATPVTVEVPQLAGQTPAEAGGSLRQVDLVLGSVKTEESRRPAGTVVSQQPPAGKRVPIGSVVDITTATPVTVAVPPLVGRTQTEATGLLKRAELVTGSTTSEESRRPAGTVLSQKPEAGTRVVIGSAVDIVTATPVMVAVPPLVDRTRVEANDLLKRAELVAGAVTLEESRRPAGTVLSQQPVAGTRVAIGTPVTFVTATPVTVLVPDLAGRTQTEAIALLKKAELVSGTTRPEESRRPVGTVLSQQPAAGRRVPIGTAVDFATATPVTVAVPQLVGRTEAGATDLLKKLELALGGIGSEEARRPPGTVISQQPEPGTRVVLGTAVAIVTARPVTVIVPDVLSRTEAVARQRLTDAELAVGAVTAEESRSPAGSVLRQSVAAGTRVTIGTAVDLVTATPVTVLVPELIGLVEEQARQRLAGVELAAGTIQQQESPAAPGTVLAQSIGASTRVPLGTLVNLVVAVVETVAVPPVVGLSVEQARRMLIENRLAVGGQVLQGTRAQTPGTVLAQSAGAGTRIAVGTPVALTVAAPAVVPVPAVVGMPHDDAAAAITAAGLTVGDVDLRFSLRAGGTVLAQAIAPGAQAAFGSSVALEEARSRMWMAPVAGVLFLGGLAGLIRARKPPHPHDVPEERPERIPPPHVAARAHVDAGEAHVRADEAHAIRREVRVLPVADRGIQAVSDAAGDLIRGERRERAEGAPPPEETS